jgi:uncharacterized RDD family membrane protein YckC
MRYPEKCAEFGMILFALSFSSQQDRTVIFNRVIAKLADLFLVLLIGGIVGAILPRPLGSLLGFAYSLVADGMRFGPFRGQSVGKKLMRLRVVNVKSGHPASIRDSVLRNAPVGVATFFAIIPLWGWLILVLIGLPLMIMEIYLMVTVEAGHRLGDVMGDTEVVEVKGLSRKLKSSG